MLSLEKPGEFDQVQRQQIRVGRCVLRLCLCVSFVCVDGDAALVARAWHLCVKELTRPGVATPKNSIVRVLDKQEVPADMILLTSSEDGGNCYIETSNIDGETNLKIKQCAQTTADGTGTIWNKQGPEALFGCVRRFKLLWVDDGGWGGVED